MGRMTSNPAIPALDEDIRGQAAAGIQETRDGLREKDLSAYLKTPRQDASSSSTTASVLTGRPQHGRPTHRHGQEVYPTCEERSLVIHVSVPPVSPAKISEV